MIKTLSRPLSCPFISSKGFCLVIDFILNLPL
jgi:hypothetical protein